MIFSRLGDIRRLEMANDTWVVTSYFNPCRYRTRKFNFDMFAARLKSTRANLLVIEMALKAKGRK